MAAEPRHLPGGTHVAPSILSADFARLGEQVREVIDAGARVVHVDVMDGDFVPPVTIGPLIVSAIADLVHDAGGAIDCHLMINRPERQVDEFARAGADSITVHTEATAHIDRLIGAIREAGCGAGVAINPGTSVGTLSEVAAAADLLLCMSVNPGWGGQSFIPATADKIKRMRQLGSDAAIEVDGGIDVTTGPLVGKQGASLFVAGSAIFGTGDPGAAYTAIAQAVGA
ncbi:MAG: ribulose-phosphate 3-epimerase [Actinomycetota bacterium]|nr:ribulose-phosphate 3-epimerase [Actinomycetota bacterium]